MHQNAFGGRALPGPAEELSAPPDLAELGGGSGKGGREGGRRGEEGAGTGRRKQEDPQCLNFVDANAGIGLTTRTPTTRTRTTFVAIGDPSPPGHSNSTENWSEGRRERRGSVMSAGVAGRYMSKHKLAISFRTQTCTHAQSRDV